MHADIPTHQELWSRFEAAQEEDDHEIANQEYAAAERLAHRLLDADAEDVEACYAVALTWYHRWLPQSERRKCLEWLKRTAELDPKHPWVPLYIGYQYFDDEQYADAIAAFSQVNHDYLASIDHHWRNLKTRELALCCRLRSEPSCVDFQLLSQLVSDYVASEVFDRPIPSEIVKTLVNPEYRLRFNAPPAAVAKQMCCLIQGIGDENVFPEQLTQFGKAAGA